MYYRLPLEENPNKDKTVLPFCKATAIFYIYVHTWWVFVTVTPWQIQH